MRAARDEGYIKVSAASTTSLQRSRQQHRSPEKQGRIWKKEKKMKKKRGVVAEPKMVLMKENGVETDPTRRRGRNGNREGEGSHKQKEEKSFCYGHSFVKSNI